MVRNLATYVTDEDRNKITTAAKLSGCTESKVLQIFIRHNTLEYFVGLAKAYANEEYGHKGKRAKVKKSVETIQSV